MPEQLLIDLGDRSPDLQLNLRFPEIAAPALVALAPACASAHF